MPNPDGTPTALEKYNQSLWANKSYSALELGNLVGFGKTATAPVAMGGAPWSPLLPAPVAANPNLPPLIDPRTGLPFGVVPRGTSSFPGGNPTAALSTMASAMPQAPQLPALNLTPTKPDVANAIDLSNMVDANTLAYYEKARPGSTANNAQLTRNIGDAAAGRLSPEDEANIIRQGVEMGAAMGVPGSPSAISGTLARYYGGIQALKDKAEALAASEFSRTPKPTDVGQFLPKPEHQIQLIIEQSRRQGTALHDQQEAALQLQLAQIVQDGKGLDRDTQIALEQMQQNGIIRHDETTQLIAQAKESGDNYRAGIAANTAANIAAGSQAEQRYQTNLINETKRQEAALKYPQGQSAGPYLPRVPTYSGWGGGGAAAPSTTAAGNQDDWLDFDLAFGGLFGGAMMVPK